MTRRTHDSPPLRGDRRPTERGFTISELMVAVILSTIVIMGVYYLFAASSQAFHVQDQLVSTQSNLRFGVEHMTREMKRAGYQATPNSDKDPAVCQSDAARPLRGVIIQRDAEENGLLTTVHNPSQNQKVFPTSVTLFGDFWSDGYFIVDSTDGQNITLAARYYDWDGDGVDSLADLPPAPALQAWFRPGRLIRFENVEGMESYHYVAAVNTEADANGTHTSNPVIVLQGTLPAAIGNGSCGYFGNGVGATVNPVGYIRYRIAQDVRDSAPRGKYDLVREELDPDNLDVVPQTQLIVSEYAVDLQLFDFVFDDGTQGNPSLSLINGTAFENATRVVSTSGSGRLGASGLSDAQRLRAATVKLSLRTMDEDPTVFHRPRGDRWDRLRTYELDENLAGAARVRSVSTRVLLEPFMQRNVL